MTTPRSEMPQEVTFRVDGVPAPGGSKRHVGKGRIIDSCKRNYPWRECVAAAAMKAIGSGVEPHPKGVALELEVVFVMPRPKKHYLVDFSTVRNSHEHARHLVKPDRTKLLRAFEDALTGILWHDDTQIIDGCTSKVYVGSDEQPHAMATLRRIA